MRILIVGASGLIGSAVAAHLGGQGHEIVMASRSGSPAGLLPAKIIRMDLARATSPEDWLPHLTGIDAVINCAGTLQDSPGEFTAAVHVDGISALFRACERAGVRRVVHLSAVGVDREAPTKFSQTKLAGDRALMERDLDWVILRPSVVVGRAAYGGSALFRGLAALPVMPVVPRTGALQLVHLDDVVKAIAFFVQPSAPSCHAVDLVGPRALDVRGYRAPVSRLAAMAMAGVIRFPGWVANAMYRLGDLVSAAGMAPPMRSTARLEIVRGATGDASKLTAATGMSAIDIEKALRGRARLGSGTLVRPALFHQAPGVRRVCAVLDHHRPHLARAGLGDRNGLDARGWGRRDHGRPYGRRRRALPILPSAWRSLTARPPATALYAALTISITYAIIGTLACAAAVDRSARPHAEDLADHGLQSRGACHP